ncbi:hypothetical protein [Streptomyces neyagawaensis]|uniref:Uncharacterized protein n=1 Tax=Streptomyces neyagawaensis TaxID=42238 RepID=A0ABV3ASC7_9ACTN
MSSGTNVVTGEDVIGAALRVLASNGELGSHDVEKVELELPDLLERYRADPVTVDQLAARRGGLMSTGLVTTVLTEPLVVAVVATLIAEGVKVGTRAVNGRVGRWWSGRRERRRLVAALREPATPIEARDTEWLVGYVAAKCEGIGCPPEQAAAVARAVATAWVARGGTGPGTPAGGTGPGTPAGGAGPGAGEGGSG